jgi:hypothetical protein
MSFRSRSLSLSVLSTIVGLASACAFSQTANRVPFTPQGISSIRGRNICDFQGEFPERFGVYLDLAKKHSVDYQKRDGVIAVFLLSNPDNDCGVVDAALDVTRLIQKGEDIEFKCYTSNEGGTTWGKWGHVVGLANTHNGTLRTAKARLAWRVNTGEKRFEELTGQTVTYDTTGYEN